MITSDLALNLISWGLILVVVPNAYFVYHGTRTMLAVRPLSPLLIAIWWAKTAIFLFNLWFAMVAIRFLRHDADILPFGGIGLGLTVLFILTVPGVLHSQVARVLSYAESRNVARDIARDTGRDLERDPHRDAARDAEHDSNGE